MGLTEQWRTVAEFPAYEVSNLGRVRRVAPSKGTRPGKLRTLCAAAGGYHAVYLRKDGKTYGRLVHRLVAVAFIGPPPVGTEVNHKNGIKTDNRPKNLEWVTRAENIAHAHRIGLVPKRDMRGENSPRARLNWDDVKDIRRLAAQGFPDGLVAMLYGVHRTNVNNIIRGKSWKGHQQ